MIIFAEGEAAGLIWAAIGGGVFVLAGNVLSHWLSERSKDREANRNEEPQRKQRQLAAFGDCIYSVERVRRMASGDSIHASADRGNLASETAEAQRCLLTLAAMQPDESRRKWDILLFLGVPGAAARA